MVGNKEDALLVGYDASERDINALVVMRKQEDGLYVLNEVSDKYADLLYEFLTEPGGFKEWLERNHISV